MDRELGLRKIPAIVGWASRPQEPPAVEASGEGLDFVIAMCKPNLNGSFGELRNAIICVALRIIVPEMAAGATRQ